MSVIYEYGNQPYEMSFNEESEGTKILIVLIPFLIDTLAYNNVIIFEKKIFDVVINVEENPCYLCARMRRGSLYAQAEELNCNKIALGHHFDDVIETTLLSVFYASEVKTMLPKLHSTNFNGLELIRPLYLIKEEDILAWVKHNDLFFLNCACLFTEAGINEELLKDYNEKFFKKNNLATIYLVISNSALELKVEEVYKVDTKLTVKYDMEKKADMGATVVSAKIVAVKIDKNIREIILK